MPVLRSDQVPWQPFYLISCLGGEYDPQANSYTFANPGESHYDLKTEGLAMQEPIRIRIQKLDVGSIKILGIPESPDPWWQGNTRMNIYEAGDGNYELGILDGSSDQWATTINLSQSASLPIEIVFDSPQGKSFTVLDENGHNLKTVNLTTMPGVHLPEGFFPNREMYFGISLAPGSSMVVTGLTVESLPKGEWADVDTGLGLSRLAEDKNLTIGTEFRLDRTSYRYCKTMLRDFNLTVLSQFNQSGFWLDRGIYDFSILDRAVNYANQNGRRVQASHLVWGEKSSIPDWIKDTNYPPETYKDILREHIQIVMHHFGTRVQEWSLANELPERVLCPQRQYLGEWPPHGDFWFEKIYGISGDYEQDYANVVDYLRMVFGWAREQDESATLIYNDGWNYLQPNGCTDIAIQSMHKAVGELNRPGQPKLVDVIGMQLHLNAISVLSAATLAATMRTLADSGTGVSIYITEMDVNLADLVASHPDRDERWDIEARIYEDVMEACLASGVCNSFSTWGMSDADSWIVTSCPGCWNEPQPNGDPLMFDKDFIPKPAYFAVREALIK